jgi:hypothetical protein
VCRERFQDFHEWPEWRVSFVTGEGGNGVQRLLLIVKPTLESYGGQVNLLLHRIVQLGATQFPHIFEVERTNEYKRDGYAGS